MRRTAVPGHASRAEGKAYMPGEEEPWLRIRGHIGRGLCECGATSSVEWSDAARKRWHAEHKQGIEWRQTDAFLDEIPGAYKPIDVVMEDARDLVEIRHTLRQIINVKGE